MPKQRQVRFKSEYAAMLAPFISEDETRQYLQGIGVSPHPDKGVLLVATNGHVAGIVHDESGSTNGDWICPLTPALLLTVTPQMRTASDEDTGEYEYDSRDRKPDWLSFVGDGAYLTSGACPDLKDVTAIGAAHAAADYAPAISATFPTWRKIVPKSVAGTQPIPFDARYLAIFAEVGRVRFAGTTRAFMTLFTGEKEGPAVIRFGLIPEFLGVIMPIKEDAPEALPDWLPEAGRLTPTTPPQR